MIAIYARQSVDREDSISTDSQIETCKYLTCGETYREYVDKGYSGKTLTVHILRSLSLTFKRRYFRSNRISIRPYQPLNSWFFKHDGNVWEISCWICFFVRKVWYIHPNGARDAKYLYGVCAVGTWNDTTARHRHLLLTQRKRFLYGRPRSVWISAYRHYAKR